MNFTPRCWITIPTERRSNVTSSMVVSKVVKIDHFGFQGYGKIQSLGSEGVEVSETGS